MAVDQDALGVQGTQISGSGPDNLLEVWSKPLSIKNAYAVMLLNRSETDTNISVYWSDLGLPKGPATVRDLWSRTDLGVLYNGYSPIVQAHGIVLLRVTSTKGPSAVALPSQ